MRWAVLLLLWTLLGLFFASETFFAFQLIGQPIAWRDALLYELTGWYLWALLAPAIVLLAHRIRFERSRRAFAAVFHASASALFSVIQLALKTAVIGLLRPAASGQAGFQEGFRFILEAGSHFNLLAYWGILAAAYALDYYRRNQQRDLRAAQLESQLAHARLQVLEMELQPHFLFNTLNAVSALVHKHPDTAERMIARLGDLLRHTLHSPGRQEVSLEEELELLQHYLDIEQIRFRDRLNVLLEVEPAALRARVPRLLLQPIVENAIRHGVARRSEAGTVAISARTLAGRLMLEVCDDGPGITDAASGTGIGLSNTRVRLQQLYQDQQSLELVERAEGGVAVRVAIPFRLIQEDPRT